MPEDDDVGQAPEDDSDAESDVDELTSEECSERFFDMLVSLKLGGHISAKTACILSFWAKGAGLVGQGATLAMSPKRSGGAWSGHFDRAVGIDDALLQDTYLVSVPGHDKATLGRTIIPYTGSLVYHKLADEVAEVANLGAKLDESVSATEWGPLHNAHPTVRANPDSMVIPIGLYMDGVSFQRRDSALGIWLINLTTGRRHLMMCLRHRLMCRCGCRRWCSLHEVWRFVAWQLEVLASGKYPRARHDSHEWPPGLDADLAGKDLGFRAAPLVLKGDWAEYAHSLGFASWQTHAHPCFACHCTGGPLGTMSRVAGIATDALPWRIRDDADYNAACVACEKIITVRSVAELDRIAGALEYDRRRCYGRVLQDDLPELGLRKNWRLEPSRFLSDIGALDDFCIPGQFPAGGLTLVFWDVSRESHTRHRNPVFGARTGVSVAACSVDELHTMHLGVFQDYVATAMWRMIQADVWHVGGNDASAHHRSGQRIRTELFNWYKQQRKDNPARPCYEIQDFSLGVLGTVDNPKLRAQAAESGTLLYFAVDQVAQFAGMLDDSGALLHAGRALVRYMDITGSQPFQLSLAAHRDLVDSCVVFLNLREAAGLAYKPKMHLFVHLVQDASGRGNPRLLGNWLDEGLNMHLASVCRAARSAVWSRRIIATFAHASGPTARAAARVKKRRTLPKDP